MSSTVRHTAVVVATALALSLTVGASATAAHATPATRAAFAATADPTTRTPVAPAVSDLAARLADRLSPAPDRTATADLSAALADGEAVPGVLLVTTRSAGGIEAVRGPAGRAAGGARVLRVASRVAQVTVAPGRELAAAEALADEPGIVAVEPARYRHLQRASADPLYSRQWSHQVARVEPAWDLTTGSSSVVVAVIDSGVDARQSDLRGNVREQRSFSGGISRPVSLGSDNRVCGDEHGTHVAGILGARGDDGTGVAGVSWAVSMLDYAVFRPMSGSCGSSDIAASDSDIIAAIRTATLAGADVVNLSLGGFDRSCSTAYASVVKDARAAGVVVVAAAGNAEQDPASAGLPFVPASCDGVISVGAVGADGQPASYSVSNEYVDLAAPGGSQRVGEGVLSTVGDDQHGFLVGTSMATPYISGVAALLRAREPGLTPDQVEGLLEAGVRDLGAAGRDPQSGWGLVDAGRSLSLAASGARPAPAADPGFPVSAGPPGTVGPPVSPTVDVFRIAAGNGSSTSAVPQAVAMSQEVYRQDEALHAVLARSDDFADALAGSALGLGVGPLLFSGSAGPLPAATRAELLRTLPSGAQVYLLGGTAALPRALEAELTALGLTPVRLEGRTREQTAVAVAVRLDQVLAGIRGADQVADQRVVLLAHGGNWPDAVAAGSIASYFGLPLLVTPTASLHPSTAAELSRRRPDFVLVLGGPAAVSNATVSAARLAAGIDGSDPRREVTRVGGADRYATAVAIAKVFERVLTAGGASPGCVIAVNLLRGDGYAHVLSASTLAGALGCVVVGAEGPTGARLPTVTADYVRGFEVDGVLAGGRDVLSDAAGQQLRELLSP